LRYTDGVTPQAPAANAAANAARRPKPSADASGPLPQFGIDDVMTARPAPSKPRASRKAPSRLTREEEAFDAAPTLVRSALDPAKAAAVLRAIDGGAPGPAYSTLEIRFFDAEDAIAAMHAKDLEDAQALAFDEPARSSSPARRRLGRGAFFAVLFVCAVLSSVALGILAARGL
jgi:hypothetical protein